MNKACISCVRVSFLLKKKKKVVVRSKLIAFVTPMSSLTKFHLIFFGHESIIIVYFLSNNLI